MLRLLFRLLLHGMLFTQLTSLLTISPNTMKNDAYFFKRGNFLLFYFSSSLLNFSLSPIKGVSETHLSISFSTNMIIEVIKQGTQLLNRSVLSELTLIFQTYSFIILSRLESVYPYDSQNIILVTLRKLIKENEDLLFKTEMLLGQKIFTRDKRNVLTDAVGSVLSPFLGLASTKDMEQIQKIM